MCDDLESTKVVVSYDLKIIYMCSHTIDILMVLPDCLHHEKNLGIEEI